MHFHCCPLLPRSRPPSMNPTDANNPAAPRSIRRPAGRRGLRHPNRHRCLHPGPTHFTASIVRIQPTRRPRATRPLGQMSQLWPPPPWVLLNNGVGPHGCHIPARPLLAQPPLNPTVATSPRSRAPRCCGGRIRCKLMRRREELCPPE
jgi:hypothetical protein